MGLKIVSVFKNQMTKLNTMAENRQREADEKAKKQLAKAKSTLEKEQIKLKLARQRLAIKRELREAQEATRKAKLSAEKTSKEIYYNLDRGIYTMGKDFKKYDREKEKRQGFPNATKLLSTTKAASDYVAKKNKK